MFRVLCTATLFLTLSLFATDGVEKQPVLKLKPGETATVVKRTVVTIKTSTETEAPSANTSATPSWRCKNIPDEAFSQLGTYSKGGSARTAWESRAGEFVVAHAALCPSYMALEKELPPQLNQKKYTDMLAVMFELNKYLRPDGLLRIAREEELDKYLKNSTKQSEEHKRLIRKVTAAKILLDLKFPEEVKGRYESYRFVQQFGTGFLDRNGNPKTENFSHLKNLLKNLTPQQRGALKTYLKDILARREYPKSGLVEAKLDRGPASLSKKEAGNRAVIQLLLFEVD